MYAICHTFVLCCFSQGITFVSQYRENCDLCYLRSRKYIAVYLRPILPKRMSWDVLEFLDFCMVTEGCVKEGILVIQTEITNWEHLECFINMIYTVTTS